MAVAAHEAVPPAEWVAVGPLATRQSRPMLAAWFAPIVLGLPLIAVAMVVVVSLMDMTGAAERVPIPAIVAIQAAALVGSQTLMWSRTEMAVRIGRSGVELITGRLRRHLPWGRVERLWVAGSGSMCPILCLLVDEDVRLAGWWRVKAYANRKLFGTPVAVPVVNTGLSERALVEMVGSYGVRGLFLGPPTAPTPNRFRRLLTTSVAAAAMLPIASVWAAAAVFAGELPADAGMRGAVQAVAVFVAAAAAMSTVVWCGILSYRAVVPGPWLYGREPVLRVGPDGVEHAVLGRVRRVGWDQVQRLYLAADRAGEPAVCVVTTDPLALVPRGLGWSARVRRNQLRYGTAVAAPLSGSGLTGPDLLDRVGHYAAGTVAIG